MTFFALQPPFFLRIGLKLAPSLIGLLHLPFMLTLLITYSIYLLGTMVCFKFGMVGVITSCILWSFLFTGCWQGTYCTMSQLHTLGEIRQSDKGKS